MSAFRVERPQPGLGHLVVDHPQRRVNVLDEPALADLEAALADLERDPPPAGLVVRSGKPGTFIAGADVEAIGALTDRAAVRDLVGRAHAAFDRLAALPCPTVAAIDGACLGGGAELALACDSRLASDHPRTRIGLPEVLLGIIPGFGGTQRLPRLVGLTAALDLILTGRALDARRAQRIGLVAAAVPEAWLLERAHERLAAVGRRPPPRRRDAFRPRGIVGRVLNATPFGQAFVLARARSMTRARTRGHYPAPEAALDVIGRTLRLPLASGLAIEAERVSDLVVSPVCKNLVRLFLLSESARREPAEAPGEVGALAVVGAGVMGGGIAELASRNRIAVHLRDLQPQALTRALQHTRARIDARVRRGRATAAERAAQLARIRPTLALNGLGRVDLALEAVVEDLDVKRRVLAELESRMRPAAVLATNTSSLSVDTLAQGLARPGRLVGLHFFNPVDRMPLVEVVRGSHSDAAAVAMATALARQLGKTPVIVADAPGFVVNRVLMPYLGEALALLHEGHAIAAIDRAMRQFGMPMGPIELIDEVGLDVADKVAGVLGAAFPGRLPATDALPRLLADGRLGRKNGRGFYRHAGGRRRPDPAVAVRLGLRPGRAGASASALAERMVLQMINEAARCLEEGVVADAGQLDLAMVFGTGFPAFRGGLLRHADTLGLERIVARLRALAAEKGPRFSPAERLAQLAADGGSFTRP